MKSVFFIAIVAVAMIGVMVPSVFADYSEIIITPISGSGSSPGCELTDEGCYSPNTAIVDVGGVVIFHNTDSVIHTFTSGIPSDDIIGTEFNTGMLEPDTIAQWTPENVGSFLYFDMIFPWMKGTIIVQEAENRDVSVEETNVSAQAHNACIDDMDTDWKISFTFEMIMDGQIAEVQPNIGITDECQRAIYTLSNDGTVYAEWIENPDFELGHFLYISKFQIRHMEESKTEVYVNGRLVEDGLKTPLQDKYHYKTVFTTKNYDTSNETINETIVKEETHSEVAIVTVDESGFSLDCVNSGCYTPSVAKVDVGGVVTMTNTDPTGVHTFTSGTVDGMTPSPDGTFDTGILMSGESFEWIPTEEGEQPYYCMLHTWMIGTIIVQEEDKEMNYDTPDEFIEQTMPEQTMPEQTVSVPFNQKSGSNNSFQDNGDFYLVFDETENYKVYEDWVKGWDPIENQGSYFENQIIYLNENFKLPYDVPIIVAECGESNAWYYSETNPSYSEIVICYELIDEINLFAIWSYQEDYDLAYEELTDEDYENIGYQVLDTVDFVLYHELGHAFIDLYNLPITGLEENVADQFAAFILLETGMDEDVSIYILNAANFWLTSSAILEIDESNYSDVHGFDKQRFYNLACYAYGSNSQFNEELVNLGWVPENRIDYCYEEYDQIVNTWMILLDDYFIDATYDSQSFERPENNEGGGCLIATATYGSELAPQVQQLRELRDNQLLQTESGSAFMSTFNDVYYSFSPMIADYERENPYFKEAVKLAITPMISTLSLMENAETESEVLGIGISVIMLNLAMYLGVPAIVVIGIRRKL